jgi:hypothetical protein
MAADIRIPVENYEIRLPAMYDQTPLVFRRILDYCTEDTGGI